MVSKKSFTSAFLYRLRIGATQLRHCMGEIAGVAVGSGISWRPDLDGQHPSCQSRGDIRVAVADQDRGRKINGMSSIRFIEQPRLGFAAGTPLIAIMRAYVKFIQPASRLLDQLGHMRVNRIDIRGAHQSNRQSSLIGHHDHAVAGSMQSSQRIDCAWKNFEFFEILDVSTHFSAVDHSVSIDKYRLFHRFILHGVPTPPIDDPSHRLHLLSSIELWV